MTKIVDLSLAEEVSILCLNMDQGPIGMAAASFMHGVGINLCHFAWDGFHRMIRDMKLDTQGVGPKTVRKKLEQARLCATFLFSLNVKPFNSGAFASSKQDLLNYFMSCESEAGRI